MMNKETALLLLVIITIVACWTVSTIEKVVYSYRARKEQEMNSCDHEEFVESLFERNN